MMKAIVPDPSFTTSPILGKHGYVYDIKRLLRQPFYSVRLYYINLLKVLPSWKS